MNVIYAIRFNACSDAPIDVPESESQYYIDSTSERGVRHQENNETGDVITTGMFPFETEESALAYLDTTVSHLAEADSWNATVVLTPLGSVHTDEVQEWYSANPERRPEDENDEPYIPQVWDSARHVIVEKSG